MSETRKSDYLGDVFGDWTVVRRGESGGDRKRRWVVSNGETEMTVLQTGLSDLALTKSIQDKNAAADSDRAARAIVAANHAETQGAFGNVFSLTEAEADLYRRLDNGIEAAQIIATALKNDPPQASVIDLVRGSARTLGTSELLREAVASVALDNDPECGTYSLAELNPFADWGMLQVPGAPCTDCGDDEDSPILTALIDAMFQKVSDAIPSPSIQTCSSFPADMAGEIARAEADMTAALQDATGDDTLSVVYDKTPLLAPVAALPREWAECVREEKIQALIDEVIKAKVALNNVINALDGLR